MSYDYRYFRKAKFESAGCEILRSLRGTVLDNACAVVLAVGTE
jgi:hypothetical protein